MRANNSANSDWLTGRLALSKPPGYPIRFLESVDKPDAYVVIGPLDRAVEAVTGQTGTRITR